MKPPQDQNLPLPVEDKKSFFGVIVHSFFVVPFLLAVFSVLLFTGVRILTMDRKNAYDYLEDVRLGGLTKRWQAAFELSRLLSHPQAVPQEDAFIHAMEAAYTQAHTDDPKVRQYLTLAMARSGRKEFARFLELHIAQEKDENLYATITALGILQSVSSAHVVRPYLKSENSRIRLAAVIALGKIADLTTIDDLKSMLHDGEVNVRWDAAVALAKMGDKSGKTLLLKLLDRQYLASFPNVDVQEQSSVMQVALESLSRWPDPDIKVRLQDLYEHDQNMNVRVLAKKVLDRTFSSL